MYFNFQELISIASFWICKCQILWNILIIIDWNICIYVVNLDEYILIKINKKNMILIAKKKKKKKKKGWNFLNFVSGRVEAYCTHI